ASVFRCRYAWGSPVCRLDVTHWTHGGCRRDVMLRTGDMFALWETEVISRAAFHDGSRREGPQTWSRFLPSQESNDTHSSVKRRNHGTLPRCPACRILPVARRRSRIPAHQSRTGAFERLAGRVRTGRAGHLAETLIDRAATR